MLLWRRTVGEAQSLQRQTEEDRERDRETVQGRDEEKGKEWRRLMEMFSYGRRKTTIGGLSWSTEGGLESAQTKRNVEKKKHKAWRWKRTPGSLQRHRQTHRYT